MSNPMDDLYDVTNGVNTVNAADHNTLVSASQFQYDGFGGTFNFGNGQDGHLFLGAISATTSTAPTLALNGSGNLTGTFYYKVSAYNLSGETAASSASATIAPSSQQVTVTIPGTGNATNITGFYIYRSPDNVTYYRVGFVTVDDVTQGATFVDNFPITSGTAPSGSNTTSASATAEGIYFARTLTMTTGQTLAQTTGSSIGLVIISQGNVTLNSGSTINATGKGTATISPVTKLAADKAAGTNGGSAVNANGGGGGLFPSAAYCYTDLLRHYNKNGSGAGSAVGAQGGSVLIISQTQIITQGTVTASADNSTAGATGSGGSGGGSIIFIAPYVNRNGGTFTANGGNAGNASGSTAGAGGGGGGLVAFVANALVGTATSTVNGGTGGTATGSGGGSGNGGGAGAGNGGGAGGSLGTTGANGSSGLVHTGTLRNTLMRF